MPDTDQLAALCRRIDGRPYPAWKELRGSWRLGPLTLHVDHVQGDPFARPSRVRIRFSAALPPALVDDDAGRVAVADWMLRRFLAGLDDGPGDERLGAPGSRGSGRSGELAIYRPGPEILRRSACEVDAQGIVELRFGAGLPARGRRILGRQGLDLLTVDLPAAAEPLRLDDGAGVPQDLLSHVASVRRQRQLRDQLDSLGLVAFVADGSVLPRDSGVGTAPLPGAVPTTAPEGLRVTLQTDSGPVVGLGIPAGITVIVGGGFHGKSTLLQALQWGHLDHVPGDGREGVVTLPQTVLLRAEDGRRVAGVDISPFLGRLPGGQDTTCFSTEDASGSTSQAAALVEAVESGSRLLLLDEDTSATNLLVRDERMRALVPAQHEPITPLVERMRQLHQDWGQSLIMVVGGVGDFLAIADLVLAMVDWRIHDRTADAKALALAPVAPPGPLPPRRPRRVHPASLRPQRARVRAHSRHRVDHGGQELELSAVGQVLDAAHAASLGQALRLLAERAGSQPRTVPELLDLVDEALATDGPGVLSAWDPPSGDLLLLRRHDVAAALNRLRSLKAEHPGA